MKLDELLERDKLIPKLNPNESETRIQQRCIYWFRLQHQDLWRDGVLYHISNEGIRSPRMGARFKKEGGVPGVADLCLAIPSLGYGALYIEMKRPGTYQTESQKLWQKGIEKHGNRYVVCRSLMEFQLEVESYLRSCPGEYYVPSKRVDEFSEPDSDYARWSAWKEAAMQHWRELSIKFFTGVMKVDRRTVQWNMPDPAPSSNPSGMKKGAKAESRNLGSIARMQKSLVNTLDKIADIADVFNAEEVKHVEEVANVEEVEHAEEVKHAEEVADPSVSDPGKEEPVRPRPETGDRQTDRESACS